jgi:hypothetical protein
MLGMLALMAMTFGGADERSRARLLDDAALERMILAVEAELYEAEVYADAEIDFASRLDEVGLAGSTLGREEARAAACGSDSPAVARNR